MKKFLKWLFPPSWLDIAIEEEQEFIQKNRLRAESALRDAGWNVLSNDRRTFFYSYKIQKGNQIHVVSIREAMQIKP